MTESHPVLWPFLLMLAGAAATYFWRGLGVALSQRLNPKDAVFDWVSCVAYALLAGLIARMIVLPIGPLQASPGWVRLTAAGLALASFWLTRKNLFLGVTVGSGFLIFMNW